MIISLELFRQLKETGVQVGSTIDAVTEETFQLQLSCKTLLHRQSKSFLVAVAVINMVNEVNVER